MELVKPAIGLVFWMLFFFGIIFFILKKYAFPAIIKGLKEREDSIQSALDQAREAREEMNKLKSDNERILAEARSERDKLLKEARETKDSIVHEAKSKAQVEADRIMKQAREAILSEKNAAINDIKNQVSTLSVAIAEKLLQNELTAPEKQKSLVQELLKDLKLN